MATERKKQLEKLRVIARLLIEKDGKFLFARQTSDALRRSHLWGM